MHRSRGREQLIKQPRLGGGPLSRHFCLRLFDALLKELPQALLPSRGFRVPPEGFSQALLPGCGFYLAATPDIPLEELPQARLPGRGFGLGARGTPLEELPQAHLLGRGFYLGPPGVPLNEFLPPSLPFFSLYLGLFDAPLEEFPQALFPCYGFHLGLLDVLLEKFPQALFLYSTLRRLAVFPYQGDGRRLGLSRLGGVDDWDSGSSSRRLQYLAYRRKVVVFVSHRLHGDFSVL